MVTHTHGASDFFATGGLLLLTLLVAFVLLSEPFVVGILYLLELMSSSRSRNINLESFIG